jgi:uncharacterized protein (DUF302 family)
MQYEFNLTLDLPFDAAVDKVKEVLMSEHLGVVSEVNVQAIMKNKLDKDIPAYRIFGACNPALADRVIGEQANAGTLLPCNFVMREEGGKTVVSFMDPVTVLDLAESEVISEVGREAKAKLERVVEKLG